MSDFSLTVKRGDTIDLEVPILRDDVAVDLTGADIWFTAKRRLTDADADAVAQKSIGSGIVVVGDAADGTVLVTLDPADTDSLTKQTVLTCDIQLVEADGRVTTVASGTLTVELDATRSTA